MSNIRYLEFRPGRWVKLVDGKAVGPATAEEVMVWKRDLAEQDKIWEDVVKHATPTGSLASQPPTQESTTPNADGASGVLTSQLPPPSFPIMLPPESVQESIPDVATRFRLLRTVEDVRGARRTTKSAAHTPVPMDVTVTASTDVGELVSTGGPSLEQITTLVAEKPVDSAEPTQPEETAKSQAESVERIVQTEQTPVIMSGPAQEAKVPITPRVKTVLDVVSPVPESEAASRSGEPIEAAEQVDVSETASKLEFDADEELESSSDSETEEETAEEDDLPRPRGGVARRRSTHTTHSASATAVERGGQPYRWFEAAPTDDLVSVVRGSLSKYEQRFQQPAGIVLCHADDLPALEQAGLDVEVRLGKGVPPRNFWVGPK